MKTLLTEFTFIAIIASLLLLLAGLRAIATYNARRRAKQNSPSGAIPQTLPGAKIIVLPQKGVLSTKERLLVDDYASEEEIV